MPTKLPFNPDTMTAHQLKASASALRGLLQRYELLERAGLNDTASLLKSFTAASPNFLNNSR